MLNKKHIFSYENNIKYILTKLFHKGKRFWNYRWNFFPPSAQNIIYRFINYNSNIGVISEYYGKQIINDAKFVLEGNIECFGTNKFVNINWHSDFFSSFQWPKGKFYSSYDLVNLHNNADVKVPWEISRCHHFIPLSKAYLISNNPQYSKRIENDITNWITLIQRIN